MPTKGTIKISAAGRCLIRRINSTMPTIAHKVAINILQNRLLEGKYKPTKSKPSPALWVAPTIEGSTKRFFNTTCRIIPATAREAPVKIMASVRGRRLTSNSCRSLLTDCWVNACHSPCHEKSATPTDKLTKIKAINSSTLKMLSNIGDSKIGRALGLADESNMTVFIFTVRSRGYAFVY